MARASGRHVWVLAHRYVGLFLAAFLILEGVTGSLLAYRGPIEAWLAPGTLAPPHPGMAPMSLAALAKQAERLEPRARVGFFSVDGRETTFSMLPRDNPATGRPYALKFDHIILDPWTGRELARRKDGDLSQGAMNIMPFVYNLHQNLAAGPRGTVLLGVVAVLWTIDCFVAAYLTLPASLRRFWPRWGTAWSIKWPANVFRVNFDLHRAGGLWLWLALIVFAWSSVMFTLPDQVYAPVTRTLFDYRSDGDTFDQMNRRPMLSAPRLNWTQAQALGAKFMADASEMHHFRIMRPYGMAYIPGWNVYTYAVVGEGNLQAHDWSTSLWVDGDSGRLVELDIPQTRRTGNTIDAWLRALHFGDLGDNPFYRALVFLIGIATTVLSVTGTYIWWMKRQARSGLGQNGRSTKRPSAPARQANSASTDN
jgi:uncharacterized iron-regulated membrane protein